MKKKLCLMLAVMLLLLSACGGQKTPETTAQEPSTAATESTPVETAAEPTQPETAAPDQTAVDSPERAAYAAYYASWLPGSPGSEGSIGDFSPKYVDLDGDGGEEMLIWSTRYGFIYEVVVQADGQTQCIYGGGSYPEDDPTVDFTCARGTFWKRTAAICRASS